MAGGDDRACNQVLGVASSSFTFLGHVCNFPQPLSLSRPLFRCSGVARLNDGRHILLTGCIGCCVVPVALCVRAPFGKNRNDVLVDVFRSYVGKPCAIYNACTSARGHVLDFAHVWQQLFLTTGMHLTFRAALCRFIAIPGQTPKNTMAS